jgi:hypothetical protein
MKGNQIFYTFHLVIIKLKKKLKSRNAKEMKRDSLAFIASVRGHQQCLLAIHRPTQRHVFQNHSSNPLQWRTSTELTPSLVR